MEGMNVFYKVKKIKINILMHFKYRQIEKCHKIYKGKSHHETFFSFFELLIKVFFKSLIQIQLLGDSINKSH